MRLYILIRLVLSVSKRRAQSIQCMRNYTGPVMMRSGYFNINIMRPQSPPISTSEGWLFVFLATMHIITFRNQQVGESFVSFFFNIFLKEFVIYSINTYGRTNIRFPEIAILHFENEEKKEKKSNGTQNKSSTVVANRTKEHVRRMNFIFLGLTFNRTKCYNYFWTVRYSKNCL